MLSQLVHTVCIVFETVLTIQSSVCFAALLPIPSCKCQGCGASGPLDALLGGLSPAPFCC